MSNTAGSKSSPVITALSPDQLTASLAPQVRAMYVHAYRMYHASRKGTTTAWGTGPIPRWDGGTDASGRTYTAIWSKIARNCVLMGIDPGRLVKVVFDSWLDARRQLQPPTPDILLAGPMLEKAQKPDTEDAACSRMWQLRVFQVELETLKSYDYSEAAAIAQLVGDQTLGLTPLFRYCIAERYGDATVAKLCHSAALLEYLFNRRGYDRTWSDLLPASLVATAQISIPFAG